MTYEPAMLLNWLLVASGLLASDLFSGLFESNSDDKVVVDPLSEFTALGLGDDPFVGTDVDDNVLGQTGNDTISGEGGDILSSDQFDDDAIWSLGEAKILDVGAGDDQMYFSDGDVATGGAGADTFGMILSDEGVEQIIDFDPDEDNVVLYVDDLSIAETAPIISYVVDTDADNTTVSLDGTPTLVFDGLYTPEELGVTLADTDSIDFPTTS